MSRPTRLSLETLETVKEMFSVWVVVPFSRRETATSNVPKAAHSLPHSDLLGCESWFPKLGPNIHGTKIITRTSVYFEAEPLTTDLNVLLELRG